MSVNTSCWRVDVRSTSVKIAVGLSVFMSAYSLRPKRYCLPPHGFMTDFRRWLRTSTHI